MRYPFWRWLTAFLLVANILGVVVYVRGDAQADPAAPAIPPLPAQWPKLVLVGEASAAAGSAQTTEKCFSIGPLPSLLAQQRAQDRLRPLTRLVRARQTVSERDRGWWVYLPAGSRSEALNLTRELAEQGMEDFYVVTRGAMENVVSVGLFAQIDNARSRQNEMRQEGFNAQLEIQRESTPQFWVDYQAEPDVETPWRFIIEASPGAQHREIPCFGDAGYPS
ncbi:MAG: SPOR domain-containing protein [Wenzhouxiangella sp.]|jgi:hypothetical protein|nr:SPOR domain-containing protein [Wenzhouxiangella sp.]